MHTLEQLQIQAISLYRAVEIRTRLLKKERIKLGKLFIRIRKQFWALQGGKHRGRSGGQFTKWLLSAGLNVGTVYVYIQLAQTGKDVSDRPSRQRITFWQDIARGMKNATDKQKIILLRRAITYLIETYNIPAQATLDVVNPR